MNKSIVIASVLKPTDDVRGYWKIAQSIAQTNNYDINIIGNEGKKVCDDKRITFHPHQVQGNSPIKRWIIRKRILVKILKLKPQLLIITTHELINISLLVKIITGCKVIYDVQENYSSNIKYLTPTIPKLLYRRVIQLKENLSKYWISEYWLAEKCYLYELKFIKGKAKIIENKATKFIRKRNVSEKVKLLFSGTISEYSGVKNAINLLVKIQEKHPSTSLKIIGQIHDESLMKFLEKKQNELTNIELNISKKSIPYEDILDAIFFANIGIIGYELNEVNQNKIPTKLYEYSRYQLPFIVSENSRWSEIGALLGGAIPINFDWPKIEKVLEKYENTSILFPKNYPEEATWEQESNKIKSSIETLLK
ncbi:MAG: hypothetical protein AB8B73_09505 [Ekhidna sp.]